MKDYIFRGKRVDDGELVYGSLISYRDERYIAEFQSICFDLDNADMWVSFPQSKSQVDPETVGQYTGIKDKNGKEIYEGDIISNDNNFGCQTSWGDASDDFPNKRVIVFDDESGCFRLAYIDEKIRDRGHSGYTFCRKNSEELFEVIGNIYSDPDLIKEKDR